MLVEIFNNCYGMDTGQSGQIWPKALTHYSLIIGGSWGPMREVEWLENLRGTPGDSSQ